MPISIELFVSSCALYEFHYQYVFKTGADFAIQKNKYIH